MKARNRHGQRSEEGYQKIDGWVDFAPNQVLWVSGHHINIAQAEQILIRHFKGKNQDRTSSDPYCTNKVEKLNAGTCDSEADTRFVLYVQLKKLDQGKERQNFKFRCLIQLEFKIKQELRIHMHQQHDYDILTCRKCGVKFTREPDLRSHVKTHNSKGYPTSSKN